MQKEEKEEEEEEESLISIDGTVKPAIKLRASLALERRLMKKELLYNRMKKGLMKYNPNISSFIKYDTTLSQVKKLKESPFSSSGSSLPSPNVTLSRPNSQPAQSRPR